MIWKEKLFPLFPSSLELLLLFNNHSFTFENQYSMEITNF